jgi:hypothetical protein
MMWSYRFVSKGPDTRNTRELPIKFKTHDHGREWVVYAGIGPHESSKVSVIDPHPPYLDSVLATIVVQRRMYTLDGKIPNTSDTRRYREIRPQEERLREKQEEEMKKHERLAEEYNARHKGDALDWDLVSRQGTHGVFTSLMLSIVVAAWKHEKRWR